MQQPSSTPHRSGLLLSLAVSAAVLLTAGVFWVTHQARETTQQQWLTNQLSALLPATIGISDIEVQEPVDHSIAQHISINKAYIDRAHDNTVLQIKTTQGYSGDIELLIAINYSGTVHGVSILQHNETPGLGDRIEAGHSDWLQQFAGLDTSLLVKPDWSVKKEGGMFDQITGATITPRAVINAVAAAAHWYADNRDTLQ